MTDPYNSSKRGDNVIDFRVAREDRQIEHVDSSTIVEKIELTAELRKEFEAMGYTFDDDDGPEAA
jgi:hypothetical protein